MHSLDASDVEAILECVSVVSMCEMSSDGRESVHVMFVCHVRVVGHVGSAPIGVDQELVFADLVYKIAVGKGLKKKHCDMVTIPP